MQSKENVHRLRGTYFTSFFQIPIEIKCIA